MRASATGSRSSAPLPRGLLLCFVGYFVALSGACGGGNDAPKCVPGNSRSCAAVGCAHGAGTQMCEQTGSYTACLCDPILGTAGASGSATDAGDDAANGSAGGDASAADADAATEAHADATSDGAVGPGEDAKVDAKVDATSDAPSDGGARDGGARDGGATGEDARDGGASDAVQDADDASLEVASSPDGGSADAADAPLTCDADDDACTPDAASD